MADDALLEEVREAATAALEAQADGERAARERVGGQLLRAVERTAKKLRDATGEYEQAIVQAVRLGLPARDIAARAGVSHGTVAAVARRHEQPSATPPDRRARVGLDRGRVGPGRRGRLSR